MGRADGIEYSRTGLLVLLGVMYVQGRDLGVETELGADSWWEPFGQIVALVKHRLRGKLSDLRDQKVGSVGSPRNPK